MKRFLLLVVLLLPAWAFSQNKLTGKVIATNEPNGMPGVAISIKGTTKGTITDLEGNYALDVENGAVLIFSFVSYKTKEITYNGEAVLNITLEEDITDVGEVVVVGYS